VLLELTLSDMSGFQALTRLIPRAYHPQIPVSLFSRVNLPPMRRLAINNEAQTYLLKYGLAEHELAWAIRIAITSSKWAAN
jgi:DNA-binding NarL/FixJ family response regulator